MARRRDNRKRPSRAKRLRVAAVATHFVIGLALAERVLDLLGQLKGLAG